MPAKGKEDDKRAIFKNEKENDKNKQNEKENLLETGKETKNKALEKRISRDTSRLRNKPIKVTEDDKKAIFRRKNENDKNKQNGEDNSLGTGKETLEKKKNIKLGEEDRNDKPKLKKDKIKITKNNEIMKTKLKMPEGLVQNKTETDQSINNRQVLFG